MGNAVNHSHKKLPVMLFGGGFDHQKQIDCVQKGKLRYPLSSVHNSILKQIGLQTKNIAGESGYVKELFA
jgi:hypothetical protein